MQQQGRRTRATDRRSLPGFFVGAYVLAWLAFAVPILAVRGALDLPAPQAVFFALATLGIAVEWQARTFQWLTPFGVVRLLIPGALGAELAAYPARAREEITAIDSVSWATCCGSRRATRWSSMAWWSVTGVWTSTSRC